MTQSKATLISFKSFLFLMAGIFAIAVTLLIFFLGSAATVTGGTPFSAVTLAEGVNTGVLAPGEQRWFKYNPDPDGNPVEIEKSLTLIFTPDDGNRRYNVSLKLYEEGELGKYFQGDTSNMNHFGAANVVDRDGNPETGELFWHGWLNGQKTYYILLENGTDVAIDYWLFTDDVINYSLGEQEVEEQAGPTEIGSDPNNPMPLMPGLTKGSLEPNETDWYAVTNVDFTGNVKVHDQNYTMYFTPDDGNRRHYVTFELFPMSEAGVWSRGDAEEMTNFGAGSLEDRDNDSNTASRVWRGQLMNGVTYLMAVENGSDTPIDYWMYDSDVFNPELGEKPAPKPKPVFAEGAAPETATPLKFGLNKSGLAPGEEAWYSFRVTDFDNENFEPMALTMITTPDDGNRIYKMDMNIFTGNGVQYWSPGDNSQINNIGAGSVVFRDTNPDTGEKFWNGWVIDNDLYYVQIRNGTDVYTDYWLYTGDVYSPELGEPTVPVVRTADPGKAPFTAEALEVGVNRGQLMPGEEQWYQFSRFDANAPGQSIDTTFTMIFTPDDGNRKYHIGLDYFEGNQLRDWAPDNQEVTGFGRGSIIDRDGDPNTGEMLWRGQVRANDDYYMRVINGSDATIDFWIFPDDVINSNLN